MNDQTSSENDEDELDEQENENKEQETGTDPGAVLTRGQRLRDESPTRIIAQGNQRFETILSHGGK